MIDAAVIGLGWWGQRLVSAVQGNSEQIRFVKAVVPDINKRMTAAEALGLSLTSAYEDVLADHSIQAVVLATPHSLHVDQVVAAAAAGKPVFCEKPLAMTRDEAQRAVDACQTAGVVLALGHNRRFSPASSYLLDALRRGILGKVLHLEAHSSNESARANFAAWRADAAELPAGGMTGTGIHLLDLSIAALGMPKDVFARISAAASTTPPEDACTVLIRFASGVSATLSMVQTTPKYWRMHVFGTKASLELLNDEEMVLYRPNEAPLRTPLATVDMLKLELEAFARAINRESAYPISPEEMVWSSATMGAICRSLVSSKIETV